MVYAVCGMCYGVRYVLWCAVCVMVCGMRYVVYAVCGLCGMRYVLWYVVWEAYGVFRHIGIYGWVNTHMDVGAMDVRTMDGYGRPLVNEG